MLDETYYCWTRRFAAGRDVGVLNETYGCWADVRLLDGIAAAAADETYGRLLCTIVSMKFYLIYLIILYLLPE